MDGGRDCSRQSSAFPPSLEVRSAAIGKEPMRPTAMDGGRDCSRQSSAFPPFMEVRSAGTAGSGSSKNLEGLPIGLFLSTAHRNEAAVYRRQLCITTSALRGNEEILLIQNIKNFVFFVSFVVNALILFRHEYFHSLGRYGRASFKAASGLAGVSGLIGGRALTIRGNYL
ncbi:hypothetical protein [Candidatus Methylobacter oryzae]|uniref:Uncharacterized protein n=1 Tax=Candidatus Methylobacter oryzae TaxID=2497749 RepID=A0ABY3C5P5_9GAMM|nr:hypothetical protein [Candidatus Methylobacter oryzae]TRW89615.1 hypothetical protein EKO24_021385 [Candidatus Methylobacter oryzae]